MGIRNATKAIIFHDNKILVNKNKNTLGEMCYGLSNGAIYYDLPGGGQNFMSATVFRACLKKNQTTPPKMLR